VCCAHATASFDQELGNRLAETFDVEIKANNSLVNPSASVENLPSTLEYVHVPAYALTLSLSDSTCLRPPQ